MINYGSLIGGSFGELILEERIFHWIDFDENKKKIWEAFSKIGRCRTLCFVIWKFRLQELNFGEGGDLDEFVNLFSSLKTIAFLIVSILVIESLPIFLSKHLMFELIFNETLIVFCIYLLLSRDWSRRRDAI